MANIVHRDHPETYTYLFRHASDPEFSTLYQQAFNTKAGKSRKELCIRKDINSPLLTVTTNILDNYLNVTYVSLQQGFFLSKSS